MRLPDRRPGHGLITVEDSLSFRPIVLVLGFLLSGLAGLMLVAALVDLAYSNADWHAFVGGAGITGFAGVAAIAATWRDAQGSMSRRQAFLLTTTCWIVVPGFAALPLMGLGIDFADAYFESASGFTTTGSTVIAGLDLMPPGILFWRSLTQWVGGVGMIVMAVFILPILRVGGMQLFQTESQAPSEQVVAGAGQLARWIVAVYAILSVACALLYMLSGMSMFDAVNHAMTTLSTGGYSTYDASFGHFANPLTDWIAIVFMVAGALPFIAFIKLARGDRRAVLVDPQVRGFIIFLIATTLVMSIWLFVTSDVRLADALRLTAFHIVSIVTTTGYATTDYQVWGPFSMVAFFILTFVGGCTGSTAGAVKIYRHQVLWIAFRAQLLRMVSPRRTVVMTYGGRALSEDVLGSVLAFIAVFMATTGAVALILALLGVDFLTAISATATCITNTGPGLGQIIGPAGNFSSLPDAAKWVLSASMLLGRVEILAFLALLDPEFWRS